jgi:ActD protein
MSIPSAIYGLFPDPASADRAFHALEAAGVSRGKIVVMSSEPFGEYSFSKAEHATAMPWLAVLGGVIGGASGFLLAAYTQKTYPLITGGMPIIAPWPTGIVTYELTMLGAVIATVVTLLTTTRLPNWGAKLYDPEISNGKVLIGVLDPSEDSRATLSDRLRGAGAEQVKVSTPRATR